MRNLKREIFDRVKAHLLTQGERSYKYNTCAYRGDNDTMCAIGCLVDDISYDPLMEGETVTSLYVLQKLASSLNALVGELTLCGAMLYDLQYLHDKSSPVDWPRGLDIIEQEHLSVQDIQKTT